MRIDPTISRRFPEVEKFVIDHVARIPDADPVKFRAVCAFGDMAEGQATRALSLDWPPTLDAQVMARPDGKFKPSRPDMIFISRRLCRQFDGNPADHGLQLLVEATILHELIHWAWREKPEPAEMGDEFEKAQYGRVVTRGNM